MSKLSQVLSGKFNQDVSWNLVALSVVGVSGILLNYIIVQFYDAPTLGVFNQVLAIYMFFSQFAVLGIHQSTLKHIAEHHDNTEKQKTILTSALLLTVVIGTIFACLCWLSAGVISQFLESPHVETGLKYITPGLLFFALNKVTLATLNGMRRMKEFAFFQATRVVVVLIAVAIMFGANFAGNTLPLAFTISEFSILVLSLLTLVPWIRISKTHSLREWTRIHFNFGAKGFLSGVMLELNTRVDIVMLGYFSSDAVVGIYSFAASCAMGFFQLLMILRNNYNPILAKLLGENETQKLVELISKGKRITYMLITGIGCATIAMYYWLIPLVTTNPELAESWVLFALLVGGIILSSGYQPFSQILIQAGRPGSHTLLMTGAVTFNLLANLFLIQSWGAQGAAMATGMAFVFSVILLRQFVVKLVGIRI